MFLFSLVSLIRSGGRSDKCSKNYQSAREIATTDEGRERERGARSGFSSPVSWRRPCLRDFRGNEGKKKGWKRGERRKGNTGGFVNNISVPRLPRLREKLWKLGRGSGTPARPSLSPPSASVYFSSAASEAGIIKLVLRGRARVLFPLCQKERKSKLQRVKRAGCRARRWWTRLRCS